MGLIQIKATLRVTAIIHLFIRELPMPIDAILTIAAITTAFTVFGVMLAWAERQTRKS
jgi:hypothetical protein